jgi:predicted protein tyrosine phosphatase
MIEIDQNLYVGSERDYESTVRHQDGWRVVHACKEPYHRLALGYRTRAASKTHPEYLIARRGPRLILNLIDAPDPAYIPKMVVDAALDFARLGLQDGQRVLIHCNQGESRAPSIGLLYLIAYTDAIPAETPEEAGRTFSQIYPAYNPAAGMWGFVRMHFPFYRASGKATTKPQSEVVEVRHPCP